MASHYLFCRVLFWCFGLLNLAAHQRINIRKYLLDYHGSTTRFGEITIGLVTSAIALIFFLLVYMVFDNASLSFGSMVGTLVLSILGYWFATLSYRLLLNKPRSTGGLISPIAIKIWCLLFAIGAVAFFVISLFEESLEGIISAVTPLPACWFGWKLANKRQHQQSQITKGH